MNQYKKSEFQKRFNSLKQEHSNWIAAYKDLSDYINPTRGIFNGDRTRIGKMIDHKKLLSGYATHALRIFSSGMNSGMTNKASQWFRLTLDNVEYLEIPGVKEWLDTTQDKIYAVINQSNLYEAFYTTYEELGQFGTGVFIILEDYDSVIRARSFTAGEYFIATDNKGNVVVFAREFEMKVSQLVKEFGLESCSEAVKADWANNQVDKKYKVSHLIEPNETRDAKMADFNNMPYRSVYWESGNGTDLFLATSGYKRFPVIAPRWDVITTDMDYGYGPGWHAIGAVKELQVTRKDKMLAQSKLHNPPVQQDSSIDGHANLIPGGVTKSSSNVPNAGVRPVYQVNPNLESFIESMNELKEEIDRFFFVNLFMMLMNVDTGKMTATEVAERQQEKIMMMGPALHRLDEEMLTPTLELVFAIMEENGMIPPPPADIQGLNLKIEYTSVLAQAQRAIGVTKIERVLGIVGGYAQVFPEMIDNIDFDEVVRQVSDMEGAPAKIVREKQDVQSLRDQRAQQQQAMQNAEMANSAADTAKKLADSDMEGDNALKRIAPAATKALMGAMGGR